MAEIRLNNYGNGLEGTGKPIEFGGRRLVSQIASPETYHIVPLRAQSDALRRSMACAGRIEFHKAYSANSAVKYVGLWTGKHYPMIAMRCTIDLDLSLISRAGQLTGIENDDKLVNEALRALIESQAARRLSRLGGSEPQLRRVFRRR